MFTLISSRSKVVILVGSLALGASVLSGLAQSFQQAPASAVRWSAQRVTLPDVTVVAQRRGADPAVADAAKLAQRRTLLQQTAL